MSPVFNRRQDFTYHDYQAAGNIATLVADLLHLEVEGV